MAAKLIKTFEELMALPAGTVVLAKNFQINLGDHPTFGCGLAIVHDRKIIKPDGCGTTDSEQEYFQLMNRGGVLLRVDRKNNPEESMMGSFIAENGEILVAPFHAGDFGKINAVQIPYCSANWREELYALDGQAIMTIITKLFQRLARIKGVINETNEKTGEILSQDLPRDS